MAERIRLTPNQANALRVLRAADIELSLPEVTVAARLIPSEAATALDALERGALVSARGSPVGSLEGRMYELTRTGRAAASALSKVQGKPAVGVVLRVPSALPSFLGWLARGERPTVEIVPEEQPA